MARTALPRNAVNAHAHVLDASVPSTVAGAEYQPFDALVDDFLAHLDTVGVRRGVVVNASTYGTDHAVLLDALRAHQDQLRGVAVVPPDAGEDLLDELHAAGVRGCRVQDRLPGGVLLDALPELARRVGPRGWHVEVWTDVTEHHEMLLDVAHTGAAPIVLDHLGYAPAPEPDGEDWVIPPLVELLATGHCWVKLSGAYRLAPPLTDSAAANRLVPRVDAVLNAAPDRVVWGSDWPYVACPGPRPTDTDHADVIDLWLADSELRHRTLVSNPAHLYDWPTDD